MSTEHIPYNPAFFYQDTVALYIEGLRCHYTSLRMVTEEGAAPYLSIAAPATPELRHVGPRARVHLIVMEPAPPYNAVVLGEFEIAERGFSKDTEQRSLTFNAVHVTAHLEQYEITTLDTATAIRALGSAGQAGGTQLSTAFSGNILELLTPEQLAADLQKFYSEQTTDTAFAAAAGTKGAKRTVTPASLTVQDVVFGTFLLYRKIFTNSRLSDMYTSVAVDMHQLIARFQYPNPDLINWTNVFSNLMTQLLLKGPQQAGGAQTFLDVIRGLCQFFLYTVNIVPNAESVTKQIQIKPMTHFNAIPHCNVFFPSMVGAVSMQEDFATTPTRLQTLFLPPGMTGDEDLTLFQRQLTMFAPAELQYLWEKILDATSTGTSTPAPSRKRSNTALTFTKPADGVPFVTLEEDRRGVVTMQYTAPPLLTTVIVGQNAKAPARGPEADLPDLPDESLAGERDYALSQQLLSTQASDRLVKYRAFLCLALGDGVFKEGSPAKTAAALRNSLGIAGSQTGAGTFFVPDRITLLPVDTQELGNCGANYVVRADGTVVQLRSRDYHRFEEPDAVPYGAVLDLDNPSSINALIPPRGQSYQAFRATSGTTHVGTVYPGDDGYVKFVFSEGDLGFFEGIKAHPRTVTARVKLRGAVQDVLFTVVATNESRTVLLYGATKGISTDSQGRLLTIEVYKPTETPQNKPWFFHRSTRGGTAWTPAGVSAALSLAQKPNVASNFSLAITPNTGNERNLVIAVEISRSHVKLKEAQATSLVQLLAAVQELQLTSVGTAKDPNYVTKDLPYAPVHQYFNQASMAAYNGFEWSGTTFSNLEDMRKQLRKEFEAWDKSLTAQSSNQAFVPLVTNADSDLAPVELPSSAGTEAATTSTTATTEQAEATTPASTTEQKTTTRVITIPTFDKITRGYLRGFLNYQFYSARVAARSLTVTLPFHPYVTPGYPALVLDSTGGGYDLVGYVHAVAHDFAATNAATTVVLTHVRRTVTENAEDLAAFEAYAQQKPFKPGAQSGSSLDSAVLQREAMIPFSKVLRNQYVFLPPINSGSIVSKLGMGEPMRGKDKKPLSNLSILRNPQLYAEYLRKLGKAPGSPCLIPQTFLPIQLHDLDTKLPPIFVYDGGFGLKKFNAEAVMSARSGLSASVRDFTTYAVYVGYNQADNNAAVPLGGSGFNEKNFFVFADTIRDLNRNATTTEAYAFNRRGIQRLGQNNLAAATASLVDYSDKDPVAADSELAAAATVVPKVNDSTVSKLPTGAKAIPEQIVVYKQPPIYTNGKRVKNGTVLTFDNTIRTLVTRHNLHVKQAEALPNIDS